MTSEIAKLKEWVDGCDNIVFFGGAGVSTESGIPDFRSVDGLYNQQYKYPPETILSHTFFLSETAEFYRFYRAKMLALDAQPNAAHLKLAEWEREGKCRAVVTQNIDGLHQKAGSKEVLELHGSVLRNYCMRCRRPYPVEKIASGTGIPKCDCGGTIKPDVVLYEEGLDSYTINKSVEYISRADMLIIGGRPQSRSGHSRADRRGILAALVSRCTKGERIVQDCALLFLFEKMKRDRSHAASCPFALPRRET